jgi:hypothetical protein
MKTLLLFCVASLFGNVAHSDVISEIAVNGAETREVSPTEPSEWRIKLYHPKTREQLKEFKQFHSRDMHLIIVKKDFSSFAHVHPDLIGKTGVFHTILNQASHDPDNEQALHAIPSAGDYYVFTETSPWGFPELGLIELSRSEMSAPGEWQRKEFQLDPLDQGGEHAHHGSFAITKFFKVKGMQDPDKPWQKPKDFHLEDGAYGDPYRASMHTSLVPGCGGNMVEFHLEVSMWDKSAAAYKTVKDLQPWLMMDGHGILLEADASVPADKIHFVHVHGMKHDGHDAIMFSYFDRQMMSMKSYRMWMQVKHRDHILTFPFSFHYMTNYKTDCR